MRLRMQDGLIVEQEGDQEPEGNEVDLLLVVALLLGLVLAFGGIQ